MHVHFAEPRWLWAGALACLTLLALFVRAGRRRTRAMALLAGPRAVTTLSPGRRRVKAALALLGTAALFTALARPLAGFRWEETRRQGIDVMFAVDTSKSMLATDLRPDRLTRAKLAVRDLVRELPGERFGLIAFAGDAFVQAPMTTDEAVFEESLDALDTSVIPRGGTDIAAAIRTATAAMASEPDRRKVLVLLSDGEDLAGDARAAATEAGRRGLTIYAVGVGTAAGEVIAARDAAGQPVRSRLDEATLTAVARATGGAYVPLGPSGRGLDTLYRTQLAQLPRTTTAERSHKVYTERFEIPLTIALGCWMADLLISERRRRGWRAAAAAAALLVVATGGRARAAEQPADVSAYNAGTGAYRHGDFKAAQQRFESATRATDLSVQRDAYYDLGNARYRVGQAIEKQNPESTIAAWKEALAAYDGALALDHADADAKFNRDLVARKLAGLEQQQKQNQPQSQNQPQQNKNEQSQQRKSSQGSQAGQQLKQSGGQSAQNGAQQSQSADSGGQPRPQSGQQAGGARAGQGQQPQTGQAGQQPQQGQGGQAEQQKPGAQSGGQAQAAPPEAGAGEPKPGQPQPHGDTGEPSPEAAPRGASTPTAAAEDGRTGSGRNQQASGQRGEGGRRPGALSRGEADQLLDSLDGQMQRLPMAGFGKRPSAHDDQPAQDW